MLPPADGDCDGQDLYLPPRPPSSKGVSGLPWVRGERNDSAVPKMGWRRTWLGVCVHTPTRVPSWVSDRDIEREFRAGRCQAVFRSACRRRGSRTHPIPWTRQPRTGTARSREGEGKGGRSALMLSRESGAAPGSSGALAEKMSRMCLGSKMERARTAVHLHQPRTKRGLAIAGSASDSAATKAHSRADSNGEQLTWETPSRHSWKPVGEEVRLVGRHHRAPPSRLKAQAPPPLSLALT